MILKEIDLSLKPKAAPGKGEFENYDIIGVGEC